MNEALVENLLKQAKAKPVTLEALTLLTKAIIKATARIGVVKHLSEFEKAQEKREAEELKGTVDEERRDALLTAPLRGDCVRAQAAVNELRCAGAKIVDRMRSIASNDPNFSHYSERAGELDAWFKMLPDFVADAPHEPKSWVAPAKFILLHFQRATGIETLSRDGPAVRFVKLALVACGAPDAAMISRAAIEKAITAK
jgi:hypothetical protein